MLLNQLTTATRLFRREDGWDEEENCLHVTPGPNGNVPPTACNSYYNFDPQFAPAVAVAVIFGTLTAIHLLEAIIFKKRYAWVLIMGGLWETLAFTLHSLGSRDQQNIGYATAWQLLFLLAPLWINAFVYMTFARMVLYWHPEGKITGLKAAVIARWFVLADVLSFIVQGAGGLMATPSASADVIRIGLNIYLGGLGLQEFFVLLFCGLMVRFQRQCGRGRGFDEKPSWKPLLFGLYAVLVCITIRIIFRIVEFSGGLGDSNPIPFHEEYAYALDCFPMMLALLVLAVIHPGRYLRGPQSEFIRLSRKEKKALKLEKKTERREEKEAKKRAKKNTMGDMSRSDDTSCEA
ncbi:RTA1 like protein-domain-containing protein [Chaetomium tenue]|uniref:RTA1 like protein-domain-containing protein n=1 Tax=Chaetomium tenue TaxID=1854479 RepID=A0ACB7PGC1_9PEZI|nr:RTA1 like protein-domain-containing protein [Chaetomium globosum]